MKDQSQHPHELISAMHDGEIDARERALVEEHLRGCAPCRDLASDLAALGQVLAEDPVPPVPAGLASRIGWSLRARDAGRRRSASLSWPGPRMLTAIGGVAAAALLVVVFVHERRSGFSGLEEDRFRWSEEAKAPSPPAQTAPPKTAAQAPGGSGYTGPRESDAGAAHGSGIAGGTAGGALGGVPGARSDKDDAQLEKLRSLGYLGGGASGGSSAGSPAPLGRENARRGASPAQGSSPSNLHGFDYKGAAEESRDKDRMYAPAPPPPPPSSGVPPAAPAPSAGGTGDQPQADSGASARLQKKAPRERSTNAAPGSSTATVSPGAEAKPLAKDEEAQLDARAKAAAPADEKKTDALAQDAAAAPEALKQTPQPAPQRAQPAAQPLPETAPAAPPATRAGRAFQSPTRTEPGSEGESKNADQFKEGGRSADKRQQPAPVIVGCPPVAEKDAARRWVASASALPLRAAGSEAAPDLRALATRLGGSICLQRSDTSASVYVLDVPVARWAELRDALATRTEGTPSLSPPPATGYPLVRLVLKPR